MGLVLRLTPVMASLMDLVGSSSKQTRYNDGILPNSFFFFLKKNEESHVKRTIYVTARTVTVHP